MRTRVIAGAAGGAEVVATRVLEQHSAGKRALGATAGLWQRRFRGGAISLFAAVLSGRQAELALKGAIES